MAGIITRFAPSPTGQLHLGHALSALLGWQLARAGGAAGPGRWLVRMEDIDTARCRSEYANAILADLKWLGLTPDGPVMYQSERQPDYAAALAQLRAQGLLYACRCTRADIAAATTAPHKNTGPRYPGTCRHAGHSSGAWRLDVAKARQQFGPLTWQDSNAGIVPATPEQLGDIVIARRDIATSYHLACVVDDAAQGITDVVRGEDLFTATHVQRLLQAVLGLPTPRYHHHPLLRAANGKRLAKRDNAETLAARRAAGQTPTDILASLAPHLVPNAPLPSGY